jgi:hypothetical protein
MKVFAEVGIGNETLCSTEFEDENGEYRVPGFLKPTQVKSYYIRLWVFKTAYILSTSDGFEVTPKKRNNFKFVFGISGTK